MRLWHKDLIEVLPRQQLLSQWRECCCIARNISVNGTPNHLLVNKILEYPIENFIAYTFLVKKEMEKRGYKIDGSKFSNWFLPEFGHLFHDYYVVEYLECNDIFSKWHNDRYLKQCFYNLQEKYDCGGIPDDEFYNLCKKYIELTGDNNV